MLILVTGGAGYIGSHTVVELIENGHDVVIIDNLCNSSYDAVARVEVMTKRSIPFYNVDIRDAAGLDAVFKKHRILLVIHFAALKAVGESTRIPLKYYSNNIDGAVTLLTVMENNGVKEIVFLLLATVYGDATRFENMIPIPEHCPTGPTLPYGQTKLTVENLIRDVHAGDPTWRAAILRYFNPIGAHPSGLIGEDPLGIPNNLLPYLAQVAVGRRDKLNVFGNDYPLRDGTPIRDYIHVVDLAKGHLAALRHLGRLEPGTGLCREWNLGSGRGLTVLEVVAAFCKAVGRQLPYEIVGRRDGDVLDLTAVPTRANTELEWKTELTIDEACRDLWKWTTDNPMGYQMAGYSWKPFGDQGLYVDRVHTFKPPSGKWEVLVANLGASIVGATLNGVPVVLGLPDEQSYLDPTNPYFGATVGRVANRIARGKVEANGQEYQLSVNESKHTLHGGAAGFSHKVWLGPIVTKHSDNTEFRAKFVLVDQDGLNGFPGTVETSATYIVKDVAGGGSVAVEYEARLAAVQPEGVQETLVLLANHAYFHTGGAASKSIAGTTLQIHATQQLEVDDTLASTGKVVEATVGKAVEGGVEVSLGETSPAMDCCFVASSQAPLDTRHQEPVAVVTATNPSGIKFTARTTEPLFQVYTGDFVDVPAGDSHSGFGARSGFCVECARYIDAQRFPQWRGSVVLPKGEVYGLRTEYEFVQE